MRSAHRFALLFALALLAVAPLAAASSPETATSTAPTAKEKPVADPGANKALCSANCGPLNSSVSCSGTVCSAINQSQTCPSGPGSVTCDGQTYYCAPCCTEGHVRSIITGPNCSCEDGQRTPRDRYKCIGGLWEYQESFCGGPFCQGV